MTQVDTGEFAEFYSTHFHRIAGQLSAYLDDHAEAQDLTQEAFCRALDRWNSVSTYDDAAGWVRRVAWNLATSRLRHMQVAVRYLRRERIEHVEGPGPERVALTRALATLPPNHRLAVVLHHLGHLSTAEIAEQQGVAEGTVRSWLSRGRSQLAEYFVEKQVPEWELATKNAIQAPGVTRTLEGVRKRRNARRAGVAAILLILLGIPVAIALRQDTRIPPIIGPTAAPASPTPTPSATASPLPVESRKLPSHGGTFAEMPKLYFVDSNNIWALSESCTSTVNLVLECQYALDFTSDRGRSWRSVNLPGLGGSPVDLYFLNEQIFTVYRTKEPRAFYLTTNGGATFTSYGSSPPAEASRAHLGEYHLLCPGANGFEGVATRVVCSNAKLYKAGSGVVVTILPLHDEGTRVINGADGRLWLVGNSPNLYVSQDNGLTWLAHSVPVGAMAQGLRLSPDGKEAWLPVNGAFYRLVGQTWQEQEVGSPAGIKGWEPIGDGTLLVMRAQAICYFKDTDEKTIGFDNPTRIEALVDGTVFAVTTRGYAVGFGSGQQREWTMFEP